MLKCMEHLDAIYIACGPTDLRKNVDGLSILVKQSFGLDPFSNTDIPGTTLDGVIRCGCWAHLRRKFVEAIPGRKAKDAPRTNAGIGRDYCDRLFKIEEGLATLLPEERYCKASRTGKTSIGGFLVLA